MNKMCFLFLMLFVCKNCEGQNIVLNGDFEFGPDSTSVGWCCRMNSTCSSFGSIAGPDNWILISNTPDRLIEGDISCDWDDGIAQSGKAFIDFVYNESGKTILMSPLEVDSVYELSYYASWQTFQGLATLPSRIQFRFNNVGNNISTPYINNPQWQYYDTIFTATANSSELELRGIENVIGGVNLDNILLRRIYTTDINEIQNTSETITIFPDPCDSELNISTNIIEMLEIVLYDISSRRILQQKFINAVSINTEQMAKGIYFYEVKSKMKVIKKGKIVKN